MKKLPILTLLVGLLAIGLFRGAQAWQPENDAPPAADPVAPETEQQQEDPENNEKAVEILRQARDRLLHRESVQAEMSQLVSLGEYKFRSGGNYLSSYEPGPIFKFRLEYRVELADLEGTFLEVCDGQILHTRRQVGKGATPSAPSPMPTGDVELSRRDIQRILKEAREHLDVPEALHAAEIGLGGLPAVLASLERSMFFDAMRTETIDEREYIVVQGRWRSDRRETLLSGLGGLAGQVENFLPDLVRVFIEKETLFPEKFLYLKLASEERQTYRPMVVVEFRNVRLDEPVPPQSFVYVAPPGVEEKDETGLYLQLIRGAAEEGSGRGAPPQ